MEWYLSDWGRALADRITIMSYSEFLNSRVLNRGSYIFSDLDRVRADWVPHLQKRWDRLVDSGTGVNMLNEPTRVKTRIPLLRCLHDRGINDFNVYPITRDTRVVPKRFPVFIREADNHKGPITKLLHDQSELDEVVSCCSRNGKLSGTPLLVEFIDTSDERGLFRKFAAFRFGPRIVPAHIMIGSDWVVKSGNSTLDDDQVREEMAYIQDNPHADQLMEAFSIANIDYGRADYGFGNGRLQIFEINTNPVIMFPGDTDNVSRRKKREITAAAIEQAIVQLDMHSVRD
jgi:hypothetical protein